MTKEELKEAIAATITENGQKGITGHALANLLNEIVDAAGEGGGDGSIIHLQTTENDSQPNEHNALMRQRIIECFDKGIFDPVYLNIGITLNGSAMVLYNSIQMMIYEEGVLFAVCKDLDGSELEFVINEDGSLTFIPEGE